MISLLLICATCLSSSEPIRGARPYLVRESLLWCEVRPFLVGFPESSMYYALSSVYEITATTSIQQNFLNT
ncbi:hypothetical protein IW262DRAFT_1389635 [Armillaria fumosa]|nr:hypothetical protein IW262DRAFT_1389635 [Armillaria fumosa]